jgi:PPM family protein phosphatase
MQMTACGKTSVGCRRPVNEDAFCVEPALGLLAVADGLGGHAAGEVASQLAISVLTRYLRDHCPSAQGSSLPDILAEAVLAANAAIQAKAAEEPRHLGMGTTVTICVVSGDVAHLAHVWDSRAYLLRDGHAAQLTEDHTVATLRQLQGHAVAAAGLADGKRLLAALGTSPWTGMDLFAQELCAGDLLLLCTDGLTAGVTDDELAALGQSGRPVADRCEQLLALANERGGADNSTVVLAEFQGSA